VNLPKAFLFNCEDSEYLSDQRTGRFPQMFNVVWQYLQHHLDFCLAHCFDDILLIMAKEKEATTFASTCASVENLFAIEFRG
jgi:hypothetical protein